MSLQKIYFWFQQKGRVIYLIYGVLALVILLPLFKSGYVFAMDMVFTPHLYWPEPLSIPGAFLYLLNFILPSEIIQKILLLLIIFLSGVGMHKLVSTENELPKYFAGIFYIFNPFVYSRFLFGQWHILLAYALMPFVVKSIFEFFNNLNFRNALKLSFWFVFIGFINNHSIVFAFLFFATAFLIYLWKNRQQSKYFFQLFKYTGLIFLIFLILSSWWIYPFLNNEYSQGHFIQEIISQKDFDAFKTTSDTNYGVLLNVAALYGFWGDRMNQYIPLKDAAPYWFILFLIILALVILGAINIFKKDKFIAAIFIIVVAVSFIFSVGVAYKPFTPIIEFLNRNIFFLRGFRDSQKFSALLVLVYAYFGAYGINTILKNSRIKEFKYLKIVLAGFLIGLPILYSPLMIWGFGGQLYVSHYSQEWFEANEILNQDSDAFKVLFFPWHQYMPFSFIENKIIANPAPLFFDKETIAGDNMEIVGIYTQNKRPISQVVENVILGKIQGVNNFGEMMAAFDIKYIILAKEADWQGYKFLDAQSDLELISDSRAFRIYQNKSWGGLFHQKASSL